LKAVSVKCLSATALRGNIEEENFFSMGTANRRPAWLKSFASAGSQFATKTWAFAFTVVLEGLEMALRTSAGM
jgi:hypothetical protein